MKYALICLLATLTLLGCGCSEKASTTKEGPTTLFDLGVEKNPELVPPGFSLGIVLFRSLVLKYE